MSEKQVCSRQREQQAQRPGGAQAPAQVLVLGRLAWPAHRNWREMSLEGQGGKVVNAMPMHLEVVAELQCM